MGTVDIFCYMVGGGSLSVDARELLYWEAIEMFHSETTRKKVKGAEFDGKITSSFLRGRLGATSGVRFSAILETESGTIHVSYLVRTTDLEHAYDDDVGWTDGPPIEDLDFDPPERLN